MRLLKDFSLSTRTAGFVAVLVGFTSSVAIVFQAAPAQLASWMWALGLGMGLCSLLPSWWLRKPVMVAWSTPGAAVLASAGLAGRFTMAEAIGAFMVCAALITFLVTLSGLAIAGIGSAFWGVLAGALALLVQKFRRYRN